MELSNKEKKEEEKEEEEEVKEILLSDFVDYKESLGQFLGREKYMRGSPFTFEEIAAGGPIMITPPENLEEQANFYRQYINPYPGVSEDVAVIVEKVIGVDWVKEQRDRIKKQPDFFMDMDPYARIPSSEDQPTEGKISYGSKALGKEDIPRYSGGGEYIKVNQLKAQIENINKTINKISLNPNTTGYDRALSILITEKENLESELPKAREQAEEDFKRAEERAFSTGEQSYKELGKKISSTVGTLMSNILSIPDAVVTVFATMDPKYGGLTEEELEEVNKLSPDERMEYLSDRTPFASILSSVRAERNKLDKGLQDFNETIYQFDEGIGQTYGDALKNIKEGNLVEGWEDTMRGLARMSTEGLAQIPNFVVAAMPYIGLPTLGLGSGSGELKEVQQEAYEAKKELDQLNPNDPNYNKEKERLEKKIERGDISGKLIFHSTVVGGAEIIFEGYSARLIKSAFKDFIGAKSKPVVEKALKTWGLNLIKQAGGEGISETGTLLLQKASEFAVLGDEEAFVGSMQEFIDNFIIGATAGGQITFAGTTPGLIRDLAIRSKVKNILEKTNYPSIDAAYNIETPPVEAPDALKFPVVNDAQVELSQVPGVKESVDNSVDTKVKKGDLTIQQGNEIKVNFRDTQSAVNQLKPVGLNLNTEAVGLVVEKKK
jgi:hypothetical protein